MTDHPQSQPGPESDYRFFPRVKIKMPVAYKILEDEKQQKVNHAGQVGETVDYSAAGLSLLTQEQLPIGALTQLALDFFQNNQPIILKGRVVRCVPASETENFRSGFVIMFLTPDDRRKMHQYIQTLIGK